ncbi:MAG: SDR family oxidoreductase [Chloroflexi bacterium]|nr:SDR family oxidoreductase [Chloroflexota bacterium]
MSDNVFFLTGCASGIGKHMAEVLSGGGECVLATDINADDLPPASDTLIPRQLDVRDADRWKELADEAIQRWGRIDVLMNIAAYLNPTYIKDMTAEDIHLQMDINAKGVMLGMQAVIPHMLEAGGGHIINISSLAGIAPIPGIALYSASKHAVRAISLAAAFELRPYNIAVSVICPDAVQTPMLDLEKKHDEAALVFTAPRILSVEDVEKAIRVALKTRRLEITLPRSRGWLTKISGMMPGLAYHISPIFTRQGLRKLHKIRASESE